ncbi:MAG TPA: BsuBI/PstI family type II restriction endonuclease [Chthoniobacterales bacterium]|nr:BsuBI/PstI family type II restriction endonuclease [Chthoniobacterales bacterium]
MAASGSKVARKRRLREAMEILRVLGFAQRQSNEVAAYVLLSLLDLDANVTWSGSQNPLRGITPMISFIRERYGVSYAPNTRETIRDEAVKYFVEVGMVLRNPDAPSRPTNSGKTVYQIEPSALALLRTFGTAAWDEQLKDYLIARDSIRSEIERNRTLARIPVKLPSGETVTLSPGGQNPLIKAVIEEFCPRFVAGGTVVYVGDTRR